MALSPGRLAGYQAECHPDPRLARALRSSTGGASRPPWRGSRACRALGQDDRRRLSIAGIFGAKQCQLGSQHRRLHVHPRWAPSAVTRPLGGCRSGAAPAAHRSYAAQIGGGDSAGEYCDGDPGHYGRCVEVLGRSRSALSWSISARRRTSSPSSPVRGASGGDHWPAPGGWLLPPRIIIHIMAPIPSGQANAANP